MGAPELWEHVVRLRHWDELMAEARGSAVIEHLEEGLVFSVGMGASAGVGLFLGFRNPFVLVLILIVGGGAFVLWTKRLVKRIRRRRPSFLSRGSEEVPASRVRLRMSVVILVTVGLASLAGLVAMAAFVVAVVPFILWELTGLRWLALYVGFPLGLLALRGCFLLVFSTVSRRPLRPSKPSSGRRGDTREYEVRFGWHRPMRGLLAAGLVFVAVGFVAWSDAPVITLISVGFFGPILVYLLMGALMRNVAIRVGAAGIVLNDRLVDTSGNRLVPWSEIGAVEVSDAVDASGRIETIRLLTRVELPSAEIGPVEDGWVTRASAEAKFWRLDLVRLARALELHAPDVPLIDVRG